ncbi:MAG: hypothetical protein NTU60_03030 [Candidatus Aminicenantes bacterium]|nr:hypothetical protein [Candidatus Aminicenantes bacterium]
MDNRERKKEKKEISGIVVKGYLRPDGTYYTSIPKQIREALKLKGGELFLIKVKPEERKFSARIIDIPEDEIE